MSHKTLVNGTVYEVDGGKTLIDGVAYSIDKGKTLVDGTAYEVGFGPPMPTIIIKWEPYSFDLYGTINYCSGSVAVDGTEYGVNFFKNNAIDQCILSLPVGTTITCTYVGYYGGYVGEIKINGNTVAQDVGANSDNIYSKNKSTYEYTVIGDATITLAGKAHSTYPTTRRSESVYITEQ